MSDPTAHRACASESSLGRSVAWTAWVLLTHLVACLIVVGVLVGVVPTFVGMFDEFGAKLPLLTVLLINLSNIVAQYWYLLLPAGLAVDAVILFALSRLRGAVRSLGTVWATLVLLAGLALLGLVVVGLFLPLHDLISQLS